MEPDVQWGPLLLAIIAWGLLNKLFHQLDIAGRSLHKLLDDSPTTLVENGKVLEQNLRRNQIIMDALGSLLRKNEYFRIEQVKFAILKTNGDLSVLPKSQYRPVQPWDLKLATAYEGLPIPVIQEGRLLAEPAGPGAESRAGVRTPGRARRYGLEHGLCRVAEPRREADREPLSRRAAGFKGPQFAVGPPVALPGAGSSHPPPRSLAFK